jgi:CRISPR/Cas system CSM-associated protein Csm2 small subunit
MTEKTLLKLSQTAKEWLRQMLDEVANEDAFTNAADADTIVQDPKGFKLGFNYALKRVREEIEKK